MAGELYVDTVDMGTLGLSVEGANGHLHAPRKRWETVGVPGNIARAAVAVSSQPIWEPRTVDVFGHIIAQDDPKTRGGLMAAITALEAAIHTPDEVEIQFIDDLTRKLVCRCERFEPDPVKPSFTQVATAVRIQFVAFDPRWVAV